MEQAQAIEEQAQPLHLADHPQALRQLTVGLMDRVRAFMEDDEHKAAFEEWKKRSIESGNPYGLSM